MHDRNSPHWQFDPSSPGWLLRKVRDGEPVSRTDVLRVMRANPVLPDHPDLKDLIRRTASGELKGKRGRKPTAAQAAKEYAAVELFNFLVPRIRSLKQRAKQQGHVRVKSDMSVTDTAHAIIARWLGYRDEASVRNLLSKIRKRKIAMRDSSRKL